ncbi:hypothetical protein HPP92_009866 [Vanilla planifolia]|uniref:Uncharacterized protein n=1 Tax=Vanilla planifolia TaxID=51239 RepID=A0A835RH14_VANPL|nr:hypothetical protein HPP92_009866 [Vanilla planifolia]
MLASKWKYRSLIVIGTKFLCISDRPKWEYGICYKVASLKDTIARKDEEIEQLQMLKDPRTHSPKSNLVKHDSSSAGVSSLSGMTRQSGGNVLNFNEKDVTDPENLSDCSDKELEVDSLSAGDSFHADEEHMGSCDADFEGRLSDVSGGDMSIGEDSEYSVASNNDSEAATEKTSKAPSRIPKPLSQQTGYLSTRSKSSDSLKSSVAKKSTLTPAAASHLKQVKR